MSILDSLLPARIKNLIPYQSARRLFSGGSIWLNANESPFSQSFNVDFGQINRYPDCQPGELLSSYSSYAGVAPENVIATRGADEAIEVLIRSFCDVGDNIIICPPTYGMYKISAQTCGANSIEVPLTSEWQLDLAGISERLGEAKLIFVCSPNNPTASLIDKSDIVQLLEQAKENCLVVVDEAYIEYCPQNSCADLMSQYPNLVILRTLSKAFALAGLRCGFALAQPDVINNMLKVIAPYPLSDITAQIAIQALSDGNKARVAQQIKDIEQERQWLSQQLVKLNGVIECYDSHTNFILIKYQGHSELMDYLVSQGILIRDQSQQLSLEQCLRITVGNQQQNQQLISAMTAFEDDQ